MYPTIVIVLAETQRSMTDIWEIGLPNASRLAVPGVVSEAHAASVIDIRAGSLPSRALHSEDVQERGLEKAVLEVKESRVSTSSWE